MLLGNQFNEEGANCELLRGEDGGGVVVEFDEALWLGCLFKIPWPVVEIFSLSSLKKSHIFSIIASLYIENLKAWDIFKKYGLYMVTIAINEPFLILSNI